MGRWARETEFDPLVWAAVDSVANTLGPWAPLTREQAFAAVKAIIARESAFNPSATRGEPHLGDASVGLMQVLLGTARDVGYPGPLGDRAKLTGLYVPGTNIYTGAKVLWRRLQQTGGDLDAAFSAYNANYRPSLGFGAKRVPATPRVCLAWKPDAPRDAKLRRIDQHCQVLGSTTPGEYSNQRYVTVARSYYAYFFGLLPGPGPARAGSPPNPAPTG